jgi:HEAT repeat protein
MSDQNSAPKAPPRKILESSPLSGITVPILIILVGALIIFGVTKMLSTGKNHRDLVDELNSKTFGNRWVAAYELSKFLAASKIPKEDIPWVIENLSQVYRETVDPRTRNFVVLALGSLRNPLSLPVLNQALEDEDSQVKFNAVTSLGNMPEGSEIHWNKVEALLQQQDDPGLRQVALLTMAAQRYQNTEKSALPFLASSEKSLRHAAAIVLIQYQNPESLPVLEEIMALSYDVAAAGELNGAQAEALKVNVLENIEKSKWNRAINLVKNAEQNDSNVRVATKAKQVLKVLKN